MLKDKIAIVTGSAQGIGRAIAVSLAEHGCKLAVCDKNEAALSDTVAELKLKSPEVLSFSIDVSNLKEVEEMIKNVLEKFQRIDILVNNAGITRDNLILRMDENEWDMVLNVNLKGTFNFIKCVSRTMVKQKGGSIVNISSIIGIIGNAGQGNYAASKAGVIGFTKSMAKELGGKNVRVNAVAPGFITTAMTDVLSQEIKNKMLESIPLKRLGSVADVSKAVLFLVSEEAAYITGQVIQVDGGMAM